MTLRNELLDLEKQFWTGTADFYRTHVDEKCLVAFPDMAKVMSNEDVAKTVKGPRWHDVAFTEKGLVQPTPTMAVLSYEATAKRDGSNDPYRALVSSGYVNRDGAWKLAFHQQTPIGKTH